MSIFKYVTEDRLDILTNRLIRFTQPNAFNDPFEMKPFLDSLGSECKLEKHLNKNWDSLLEQEYMTLSEQHRLMISLDQFKTIADTQKYVVKDNLFQVNQTNNVVGEIGNTINSTFEKIIGILCLTKNPKNLLMWAHYTDSHKGFVIEFDELHPFLNSKRSGNDEFFHLREVKYSTERPNWNLMEVESFNVFLTKSQEWAYEEEWRMLRPLKGEENRISNQTNDIYLFSCPLEAIKSIIMGCRMTQARREEIKSILKKDKECSHIELFQSAEEEKLFSLKFEQINI